MDPGWAALISTLGAALIVAVGAAITRHFANAAKKARSDAQNYAQAQQAEGEAYKRARVMDDQVVARLQAEVTDLEEQTAELRVALARERHVSDGLRQRVWDLERTVAKMRSILAEHGINGDTEPSTAID